MLRNEIIAVLDRPVPYKYDDYSEYEKLKECLRVEFYYEGSRRLLTCREIDEFSISLIDNWFYGVIRSLFYRPNHLLLVLQGKQGIGKTQFLRRLLPLELLALYTEEANMDAMYGSIICNLDIWSTPKKHLNKCLSTDGFVVRKPYTEQAMAEKRLTSYCTTSNVPLKPDSVRTILLNVESIDQELYNSINKLALWVEIFNKFKPD